MFGKKLNAELLRHVEENPVELKPHVAHVRNQTFTNLVKYFDLLKVYEIIKFVDKVVVKGTLLADNVPINNVGVDLGNFRNV